MKGKIDKFNACDGLLQIDEEELAQVIKKQPIKEVYNVDENLLGSGAYAKVCRATHKLTGIPYAAKFVRKRRRNKDQMNEIKHEIAVLLQCSPSDRIIRLHEVYESNTEMVLVLELADGGDLHHILEDDQCLGEDEARKAMLQILEGVAFLHEENIAHLDLKPQNLLLTVQNSCDDIKLCDFGISKVLQPGVTVREILGTPDYVAPEILNYEPISLAADIWSVGVLGYVLLSGFSPFGAEDKKKTYLNISTCALSFEPEHFADISTAAIDFIKSCLVIDPRRRPSARELLDHRWLTMHAPLVPSLPPCNNNNNHQHSISATSASTPDLEPEISLSSLNNCTQRKSVACGAATNFNNFDKSSKSTSNLSSASSNNSIVNGSSTYPESTTTAAATAATVRTYSVSANCLCSQCDTTCRHITHTPVSKTTITIDRGIL